MRTSLLIDTDPGIDDAVALALAASYSELEILAITTVHGNTDIARATRNARFLARTLGLRVLVSPGAATPLARAPYPARVTHGEEGLGNVIPTEPSDAGIGLPLESAAQTIARLAREHPGLTVCCLGPLTNLALALAAKPLTGRRLGPVFVMGGALAVRGTQTRWSEFNWWSDPESVEQVLLAGLDLRVVPLDVTRRIAIPADAVEALRRAGQRDSRARLWGDALGFYIDFHRAHEDFAGCVVNDPLVVALIVDEALADWKTMRIVVDTSEGDRRGALMEDAGGRLARVAVGVRAEAVLDVLHRRLFAEWLKRRDIAAGATAAEEWLRANPR